VLETTLKAFANASPGLRFGNPGNTCVHFLKDATLKESVGKIKNREKWGYKNHSAPSKNSLKGKCEPKVFGKSRRTLFSDRL
jgi:hypothetical protein